VVIDKFEGAVKKLDMFTQSQGMIYVKEEVPNLKGDAARSIFINLFKDVQQFKSQLDQYTDLTTENTDTIEQVLPQEQLQAFCGVYLETAQSLKTQ
jgi:type I restriction enzyme R subunit